MRCIDWDGMRLCDGMSLWQVMPSWAKWWAKSQLSDELSHRLCRHELTHFMPPRI
jgi:hypothetical protein